MAKTEHWSKRLDRAMTAKGWKAPQLIRATGLGKSLVYQYLNGEVDQPREPHLTLLTNALAVSKSWLMHGENAEASSELGVAVRRIPVLTLKLCGELSVRGQLADLASGEFLPVGADVGPRSAVVRVEDEAISPLLRPGDMVVVDPDAEPIPGRYVLALVNGVAYIRRYRPLTARPDGPIELLSENTDFPPIDLTESGRILGRVIKRISDL